jgi:hypothetical protein
MCMSNSHESACLYSEGVVASHMIEFRGRNIGMCPASALLIMFLVLDHLKNFGVVPLTPLYKPMI